MDTLTPADPAEPPELDLAAMERAPRSSAAAPTGPRPEAIRSARASTAARPSSWSTKRTWEGRMSSGDDAKPGSQVVKAYQPTPEEFAAATSIAQRKKDHPPAPKLKIGMTGKTLSVAHDHPDSETGWLMLVNALGTTNYDFADGLISQLMNAGTQGQAYDDKGPNFMLSVIQGIGPKDEAESMLAAQMAAVHMATMTFARRLAHVDNIAQQDSAERAFNKLARTFAVQMEALKRYRTGGEQRVTVQHVTVNEGGQAIVGAVSPAAGGVGCDKKSEGQPHASPAGLAYNAPQGAVVSPLRSEDPKREALRVASDG